MQIVYHKSRQNASDILDLTCPQKCGIIFVMSIHVQTGNRLDVLITYKDGEEVIIGLKPWGSEDIIPLPEPEGLMSVLARILKKEFH